MKKILNSIWEGIKFLWYSFPKYVLYTLILAFLGGFIAKWIKHDQYYFNVVFAIIFFGIIGCVILYVWGRQIYWWITKTGDYKKEDVKK